MAKALSILGLMNLSFLLGALIICLRIPPAGFIMDAYIGIHTYFHRKAEIEKELSAQIPGRSPNHYDKIDIPSKTYNGYTLSLQAPGDHIVRLYDMKGDAIHTWNTAYSHVWKDRDRSHIDGIADDSIIYPFFAYLFPNGDLVVTYHGQGNGVSNGYGMAKIDKDSNTLWIYSANCHHDLDVAEDGKIYGLQQRHIRKSLKGLEFLSNPCMVDDLVILSPDGQMERVIPIIETLRDSPYGAMLAKLELPYLRGVQMPTGYDDDEKRRDVMHTNHVQILTKALAPKFPMFKAGQVMLSMRHLDMICVFDVDGEKPQCVWAARGPWKEQHDPEFLDNGRILLFDNRLGEKASRVIEFDPVTQAMPWCFWGGKDWPLYTFERGDSQRLPNGNTFIASTHGRVMLEVTPDKKVVWQLPLKNDVNYARRFGPDQLTFIDKKEHPPRPR